MPTMWVTEFVANGPRERDGSPAVPPIGTQVVTFSTSAATANALSAACDTIQIVVDTDAHVSFAPTPTATVNDMFLVKDIPHRFTPRTSGIKVAAIAAV